MLGSGHFIIRSIRSINPAVAVLTLLTLGNAQTRLALLSLTRKVRVQKKNEESRHPSALFHLTSYILHPEGHPSSSTLGGMAQTSNVSVPLGIGTA